MARLLVAAERLPDYGIVVGNKHRKRLEAAGRFPKRVPLTERKCAYVEAEILDFLEQRVHARDRGRAA